MDNNSPIFIIGSPRSGTSVLHWSLLQHDQLWGSEESEFLLPIANAIQPAYDLGIKFEPHSWLRQQQVELPEFAYYLGKGIADLYASRANGKRWVEQTPSYTMIAHLLALLFPNAQFLFIIRDGRQVVDSMQRMWQWDIPKATTTWCEHINAGLALKDQYPERVLNIRYEQLVQEPQLGFKRVFDFLQLADHTASAEFMQGKPINVSPGTESQSTTDKLEPRWLKWKWSEQRAFKAIAKQLMQQLEYN